MQVTIPADLQKQRGQQIAAGRFRDTYELLERAIRQFLEKLHLTSRHLTALRNLGAAVGQAGLFDRVLLSTPVTDSPLPVVLNACVVASFGRCEPAPLAG